MRVPSSVTVSSGQVRVHAAEDTQCATMHEGGSHLGPAHSSSKHLLSACQVPYTVPGTGRRRWARQPHSGPPEALILACEPAGSLWAPWGTECVTMEGTCVSVYLAEAHVPLEQDRRRETLGSQGRQSPLAQAN